LPHTGPVSARDAGDQRRAEKQADDAKGTRDEPRLRRNADAAKQKSDNSADLITKEAVRNGGTVADQPAAPIQTTPGPRSGTTTPTTPAAASTTTTETDLSKLPATGAGPSDTTPAITTTPTATGGAGGSGGAGGGIGGGGTASVR
jgi:hypothetical protein